jgi:Tol biopolymer transport system component
MNPNAQFERDLERWLQAEAPATAPAGLHAAVIDRARTRRQRPGWATSGLARWFGRNRGLTLLAAGALLLVGGAMAAGSGLVKLPSLVPPEPAPSLPVAVASPTAGPTIAPAPTATPAPVPPRASSWAATGSMITPRYGHTAVSLADGSVLVVGGYTNRNDILASAELYDPATGSWTATGSMLSHAGSFTATLLRDGRVLVIGSGYEGSSASAELYDPHSGSWTATGSMIQARGRHTATLLPGGKVLVAGGYPTDSAVSAELYDPATGTWTATGNMGTPRANHEAALLPDGKVLVTGGDTCRNAWAASECNLHSAELYDPASGTWTYTNADSPVPGGPSGQSVVQLPDDRMLAVVPVDAGDAVAGTSVELYDPGTGSWTAPAKATMGAPRYSGYSTTLLSDGIVLVAGGIPTSTGGGTDILASADLYDPGTPIPGAVVTASPTPTPSAYAAQPTGSMFAYVADRRVWVANRDGTGAHELIRDLSPDLIGTQSAPAWSLDGSRLVFSQTRDGDASGTSRFYVTDASASAPQLVDTGCVAPCVHDTDPAFSRDGTKLVFVRTNMVPPASTKPIPAAFGGGVAGDREASVIAMIDLSTGKVTELASTTLADCPLLPGQKDPGLPNCGGFADHNPRWSPDGTQIVFGQDVPSDINGPEINGAPGINYPFASLFVVDADGGNLHRVSICCESADWSPDGARIVFGSSPRPVPIISPVKGAGYKVDPNSDIYTVRPDGTDLRRLTSDRMSDLPSWTAEGRIWFVRNAVELNRQLWIMDSDGSNATQASVSPQLPLNDALFSPYGRPPKP